MPCTVELLAVDPSLVKDVWPHVRGMVKSAIDRTGLCNFEPIETEVLAGLQQLWITSNGTGIAAAGVTQLVSIGGRKICVAVAAGGRGRNQWAAIMRGIEQFARNEGCHTVRIIGRKGWQRILADYRSNYIVMDKEL